MFRTSRILLAACLALLCLTPNARAASLGKNPSAGLVRGTDGSFYGTTANGGTNDLGTAFKIDGTSGLVTTLINFTGVAGTNAGSTPLAPLIFGSEGKLYGTTSEGGANNLGTVFRVSVSGVMELLHSFGTGDNDGANPKGKITQGADGNYYGMTYSGATSTSILGTIYRITPNGTETVLFRFDGAKGAFPTVGLVQGRDGNFYGVSFAGGDNGLGTFFKMDPLGIVPLPLYSFDGGTNGSNPQGELVEDPLIVGRFYGVASNGGANGYGSVYRVDAGTPVPVVLATFTGTGNGANPHAGLALSADGKLNGTTFAGGANNLGTFFQITDRLNGGISLTRSFTGLDGAGPNGAVIENPAKPGTFYGTTYSGGEVTSGTVFSITPPGQLTTVVDFANPNGSAPPVITSATSATVNPGTFFDYYITATGNPESYAAIGLPSFLSITENRISGTVTTAGNYAFTIKATNSAGEGTAGFQLIALPGAPSITSTTTASGQQGQAFGYQITATNNPTSFGATGLPPGLTLSDPSTGAITGTALVSGEYDILITATNSSGTGSGVVHLSFLKLPPIVTGVFEQTVPRDEEFQYSITASNNPDSYAAFVLPFGLSIDGQGEITGKPVVEGTYDFTLVATNDGGSGSATFTLTVVPPPPEITSLALAAGSVGEGFVYQIKTKEPILTPVNPINGVNPSIFPFAAFGVPPGLTIDRTSGIISGTPLYADTYTVVLEVGTTGGIGYKELTLVISPEGGATNGVPTITSPLTASGQENQVFSYQITAGGGATSYSAVGLPAGLTVNALTGLISGKPSVSGEFSVTLFATNAIGSGSAILDLTISSAGETLVHFDQPSFPAISTNGSVVLTVDFLRADGDVVPIAVDFATADGTAKAGVDYVASSGTLVDAGSGAQQSITIPLIPKTTPAPDLNFTVTLSNLSHGTLGAPLTATVTISYPDLSTKLQNISTRGIVGSGDEVMIAGFISEGQVAKQLVIRGIGPSLTAKGVVDALLDPSLTVMDSNGTQIAYDNDYADIPAADQGTLVAYGLTPTESKEAALVANLPVGNYTVLLQGTTNGAGLVEIYDISDTRTSHFVNISTRAKIESGNNGPLIGGFIVGAPAGESGGPQTVLIRGLGPSLGDAGVAGVLADPTIELYLGSRLILSNDNWKIDDEAAIEATGLAPAKDKEAAILVTLDPGAYTAVIRGKNDTTGIGLVEVYQMP